MKTNFKPHLEIILKEMCRRVGANFSIVGKPDWYSKHLWTTDEENKFRLWMFNYLMSNKEAREELMDYPRKTKLNISNFIDLFILAFGWKTNLDEIQNNTQQRQPKKSTCQAGRTY